MSSIKQVSDLLKYARLNPFRSTLSLHILKTCSASIPWYSYDQTHFLLNALSAVIFPRLLYFVSFCFLWKVTLSLGCLQTACRVHLYIGWCTSECRTKINAMCNEIFWYSLENITSCFTLFWWSVMVFFFFCVPSCIWGPPFLVRFFCVCDCFLVQP